MRMVRDGWVGGWLRTPGVPDEDFAAVWKFAMVLYPNSGALIALKEHSKFELALDAG